MTKTLQQLISMARECVAALDKHPDCLPIRDALTHDIIANGLKPALEALDKFDADQKGEVANALRHAAQENYSYGDHGDGNLEVDDDAIISLGDDNGAYVEAWVWVYFGDIDHAKCRCCDEVKKSDGDWYDDVCPSCADKANEIEEHTHCGWDKAVGQVREAL